MSTRAAIVTSIQAPTSSLLTLARFTADAGMHLFVIGDRKSPSQFQIDGARFWSVTEQLNLDLDLPRLIPENHYARKNIGYLLAIQVGASAVFDTDDDNAPMRSWHPREEVVAARKASVQGWTNVYSYFTGEHIWPRGLPLEFVRRGRESVGLGDQVLASAPIQQSLVNGSPDVDAIWRLLMDRDFTFDSRDSVRLGPGTWCPFNSQSTWWFGSAFPLMYLPSYVSFRMTDIWRSFVAQRCIWEMGAGVVFHAADMFQDRNAHNLLRDFEQEIPGYLGNGRLCDVLERLPLAPGAASVADNLVACYEALIAADFVPAKEMRVLQAWLNDLETILKSPQQNRSTMASIRS